MRSESDKSTSAYIPTGGMAMELTRDQQQFILNAFAEVLGDQLGVELRFTLKDEDKGKEACTA